MEKEFETKRIIHQKYKRAEHDVWHDTANEHQPLL